MSFDFKISWIMFFLYIYIYMCACMFMFVGKCVHVEAWDRFWVSSITFYLFMEAGSVKWTWELANVLEWLSGFQELELQADYYAHPTSTWMLRIKSDHHAFMATTLNH